jgi:hypothetical protein
MADEAQVEDPKTGEATAPKGEEVVDPFMSEEDIEVEGSDDLESLEEGDGGGDDGEGVVAPDEESGDDSPDGGDGDLNPDDTGSVDPPKDDPPKVTPKSQHKTGDQRFSELTEQRYQAESRAALAEEKYLEVVRELESLKNPPQAQQKPPEKLGMPKMPLRSSETINYDDDKYAAAMDQYQADLQTYQNQQFDLRYAKQEEVRLARNAESKRVESRKATENAFHSRKKEYMSEKDSDGKLLRPDYEAVSFSDKLVLHDAVAEALITDEHGPALLYHLGKNPQVAESLMKMTPVAAVLALGKINVAGKITAKTKKISGAPDPIETLDGPGKTGLYDNDETMPIGDFMAKEERNYWGS